MVAAHDHVFLWLEGVSFVLAKRSESRSRKHGDDVDKGREQDHANGEEMTDGERQDEQKH